MKATIFRNTERTNIIISNPNITTEECRENLKHIYTTIMIFTHHNAHYG